MREGERKRRETEEGVVRKRGRESEEWNKERGRESGREGGRERGRGLS